MKHILLFIFFIIVQYSFAQQEKEYPLPYSQKESPYDIAPEFIGGSKALQKYFQDSIRYPEPEKIKKLQGAVSLKILIDKKGKITKVEALNGVPGAPNFVKESIRVINTMPNWIPATKKGKPVDAEYYLSVPFKLKS